jgi:uncharacterized protein (DUF1697 family)
MPSFVLLLRGINVGGHKLVPMAELRALIEREGFEQPRTLLQSGNAVFKGRAMASAALEQRFERALEKQFGFDVDCMVRTAAEWERLMGENPFPAESKRDPGHVIMIALDDAPAAKAVEALRKAFPGRERVGAAGRQLWAYYPDGAGRSKLTLPLIEKTLGTRGTGRNWNTVVKISQLLQT